MTSAVLYCHCRGPDDGGFMIQCERCEEWFHGRCVGLTEETGALIQNYVCAKCDDPAKKAAKEREERLLIRDALRQGIPQRILIESLSESKRQEELQRRERFLKEKRVTLEQILPSEVKEKSCLIVSESSRQSIAEHFNVILSLSARGPSCAIISAKLEASIFKNYGKELEKYREVGIFVAEKLKNDQEFRRALFESTINVESLFTHFVVEEAPDLNLVTQSVNGIKETILWNGEISMRGCTSIISNASLIHSSSATSIVYPKQMNIVGKIDTVKIRTYLDRVSHHAQCPFVVLRVNNNPSVESVFSYLFSSASCGYVTTSAPFEIFVYPINTNATLPMFLIHDSFIPGAVFDPSLTNYLLLLFIAK